MNKDQIIQAADELSEAIKSWRLQEHRGEFLIFRMPDTGTNVPSGNDGEQMAFWRFDKRHAAERFRNRKILAEISALKGELAA